MKVILIKLLAVVSVVLAQAVGISNPAFAQAAQVTYYHVNSQGTPAATDEMGSAKWMQEHSNFGYHKENVGQFNDTSESNFGISGHVEDQHDDQPLVLHAGVLLRPVNRSLYKY